MSNTFNSNVKEMGDVRDALRFIQQRLVPTNWTSFDINWKEGGTNAVVNTGGNALNAGYYRQYGFFCYVSIRIVIGSTFTPGTGDFSWTLPFATMSQTGGPSYTGTALAFDNGTPVYRAGVCEVSQGATSLTAPFDGASTPCQFNSPFTWAANDTLKMSIIYPIDWRA